MVCHEGPVTCSENEDLGKVAADEFDIELRPRLGGQVLGGLRFGAAVIEELFQGWLPAPSLSDLVVSRRSGGTEVSRTSAGDSQAATDLLLHVRTQFREQSVEQFMIDPAGRRLNPLTPPLTPPQQGLRDGLVRLPA